MRNLERNKKQVYLVKIAVDEENEREVFEPPIAYRVNYQPVARYTSNGGELIATGGDSDDKLAIYTTPEIARNFHNFDRVYMLREIPKKSNAVLNTEDTDKVNTENMFRISTEDFFDKSANTAEYCIDGEPLIVINEATIYLQRMTGKKYE